MPRPAIFPVVILASLALLCPLVFAEDGVKTDARVKGVEKQLERESKPVDLDAKRAKDSFVAAYQKECKARVKVLESAMAACEKKIKMAKSASDAKSEAALTAKLEELKVELETWKGNEGKKWAVKLEEEGEEDAIQKKEPDLNSKIVGKWNRPGFPKPSIFYANGKVHDHGDYQGTWKLKKNGHIEASIGIPGDEWTFDIEMTGKDSAHVTAKSTGGLSQQFDYTRIKEDRTKK